MRHALVVLVEHRRQLPDSLQCCCLQQIRDPCLNFIVEPAGVLSVEYHVLAVEVASTVGLLP